MPYRRVSECGGVSRQSGLIPMRHGTSAECNEYCGFWTLAELVGRQAGVLAASPAKLAKRKHTASRLRSTTTMTTSVCVLLSVVDCCA